MGTSCVSEGWSYWLGHSSSVLENVCPNLSNNVFNERIRLCKLLLLWSKIMGEMSSEFALRISLTINLQNFSSLNIQCYWKNNIPIDVMMRLKHKCSGKRRAS